MMKSIYAFLLLFHISTVFAQDVKVKMLGFCSASDIPRDYYTVRVAERELSDGDMFACIRVTNNSDIYTAIVRCNLFKFDGALYKDWTTSENDNIALKSGESFCFFIVCPEKKPLGFWTQLHGVISLIGKERGRGIAEMEVSMAVKDSPDIIFPEVKNDAIQARLVCKDNNAENKLYAIHYECQEGKAGHVLYSISADGPTAVLLDKRVYPHQQYAYFGSSCQASDKIIKIRLFPGDVMISDESSFFQNGSCDCGENHRLAFEFSDEVLRKHLHLITDDLTFFPGSEPAVDNDETLQDSALVGIGIDCHQNDADLCMDEDAILDIKQTLCDKYLQYKYSRLSEIDFFPGRFLMIQDARGIRTRQLTQAEINALNAYIHKHASRSDSANITYHPEGVVLKSESVTFRVTQDVIYLFLHHDTIFGQYIIKRDKNDNFLMQYLE